MRTIRIDDYPDGMPGFNRAENQKIVRRALGIFESNRIPYYFGVTPFYITQDDADFLNSIVKFGQVVMHGFTHKLDHKPWSTITDTWPKGGEFAGMREWEIEASYDLGRRILRKVNKFTPDHFIAPFNCWTQEAVNALARRGVKTLHGCSKEWDAYGYAAMNYHGMQTIIAPYQTTYHDSHEVVRHLRENPEDESQIVLHWIFDKNRLGWEGEYQDLCDFIREEEMV